MRATMANTYDGTLIARGDDGYEQARRAAVWNARTPERYPEAIVLASSEADVVRAVSHARAEGMRVGVRSGGHSWAATMCATEGCCSTSRPCARSSWTPRR